MAWLVNWWIPLASKRPTQNIFFFFAIGLKIFGWPINAQIRYESYCMHYNFYLKHFLIRAIILFLTRDRIPFRCLQHVKDTVLVVIRFHLLFIVIHNCYGIRNNTWKFHVSTMKIVPVARIWSSCVIHMMMRQCFRKGNNIWW